MLPEEFVSGGPMLSATTRDSSQQPCAIGRRSTRAARAFVGSLGFVDETARCPTHERAVADADETWCRQLGSYCRCELNRQVGAFFAAPVQRAVAERVGGNGPQRRRRGVARGGQGTDHGRQRVADRRRERRGTVDRRRECHVLERAVGSDRARRARQGRVRRWSTVNQVAQRLLQQCRAGHVPPQRPDDPAILTAPGSRQRRQLRCQPGRVGERSARHYLRSLGYSGLSSQLDSSPIQPPTSAKVPSTHSVTTTMAAVSSTPSPLTHTDCVANQPIKRS